MEAYRVFAGKTRVRYNKKGQNMGKIGLAVEVDLQSGNIKVVFDRNDRPTDWIHASDFEFEPAKIENKNPQT